MDITSLIKFTYDGVDILPNLISWDMEYLTPDGKPKDLEIKFNISPSNPVQSELRQGQYPMVIEYQNGFRIEAEMECVSRTLTKIDGGNYLHFIYRLMGQLAIQDPN